MSRKKPKTKPTLLDMPSHSRFCDLISYCVRGHTQPAFDNGCGDDHGAELCMLMLEDTDEFFWFDDAPPEAGAIRETLDQLAQRINEGKDLRAAETLYAVATYAAFEVLDLFLRNRKLFEDIAPRRKLMPCLASIHPNTARVTTAMEKASRLGQETNDLWRIKSKAWFTSDAAANVYARTIVTCVEMNRHLEPVEVQQKEHDAYDREHPSPWGRARMLPFPKYVAGLDLLPIPMTPASVPAYWRKGKEMILEEMPDFHLLPEWEGYHHRTYKHGAKTGAIQHAIFKDILAALRTMAGGNKEGRKDKPAGIKRGPK